MTSEATDDASVGRWTNTEHDKFVEGLTEFGRDWKKIADLVPTRTIVQIRTHAQKYFVKLAKDEGIEAAESVFRGGYGTSVYTSSSRVSQHASTEVLTDEPGVVTRNRSRQMRGEDECGDGEADRGADGEAGGEADRAGKGEAGNEGEGQHEGEARVDAPEVEAGAGGGGEHAGDGASAAAKGGPTRGKRGRSDGGLTTAGKQRQSTDRGNPGLRSDGSENVKRARTSATAAMRPAKHQLPGSAAASLAWRQLITPQQQQQGDPQLAFHAHPQQQYGQYEGQQFGYAYDHSLPQQSTGVYEQQHSMDSSAGQYYNAGGSFAYVAYGPEGHAYGAMPSQGYYEQQQQYWPGQGQYHTGVPQYALAGQDYAFAQHQGYGGYPYAYVGNGIQVDAAMALAPGQSQGHQPPHGGPLIASNPPPVSSEVRMDSTGQGAHAPAAASARLTGVQPANAQKADRGSEGDIAPPAPALVDLSALPPSIEVQASPHGGSRGSQGSNGPSSSAGPSFKLQQVAYEHGQIGDTSSARPQLMHTGEDSTQGGSPARVGYGNVRGAAAMPTVSTAGSNSRSDNGRSSSTDSRPSGPPLTTAVALPPIQISQRSDSEGVAEQMVHALAGVPEPGPAYGRENGRPVPAPISVAPAFSAGLPASASLHLSVPAYHTGPRGENSVFTPTAVTPTVVSGAGALNMMHGQGHGLPSSGRPPGAGYGFPMLHAGRGVPAAQAMWNTVYGPNGQGQGRTSLYGVLPAGYPPHSMLARSGPIVGPNGGLVYSPYHPALPPHLIQPSGYGMYQAHPQQGAVQAAAPAVSFDAGEQAFQGGWRVKSGMTTLVASGDGIASVDVSSNMQRVGHADSGPTPRATEAAAIMNRLA